MPIVASFLTVSEYGEVSLFQSVMEIITIFGIFGGHQYYRNNYFKSGRNKEYLYFTLTLYNSSIVFLVLLILTLSLALFDIVGFVFVFAPLGAFFQSIASLYICKYQNIESPLNIAKISALLSSVTLLLSVGFLYSGMGVEGRISAIVLGPLIVGTIGLYFIFNSKVRHKLPRLSELKSESLSSFIFGLKFLPTSISWWLRAGLDRLVISHYLGTIYVGVFSVVIQVSLLVTVLGVAINNALMPTIYRNVKNDRHSENFKLLIILFGVLMFICGGGVFLIPPVFKAILPESYYVAFDYIELALLGVVLHSSYLMISNILVALSLSGILSIISISSAVLHVVCSLLLVSTYKVEGVLISGILSFSYAIFLSLIVMVWKVNKLNLEHLRDR